MIIPGEHIFRTLEYLHDVSIAGALPSWHTQSEHWSVLAQAPQQSPLSKLHPILLASSLQKPLPMSSIETGQSEIMKERKYKQLFTDPKSYKGSPGLPIKTETDRVLVEILRHQK